MIDGIALRPLTEDDAPFLRELYGSTRAEEMAMMPWTDAQKQQFIDFQFHAQSLDYASNYNVDDFRIIERDGIAIGRLYLDRTDDDIAIVDIALIPAARGQGIGTGLVEEVMSEARRSGKSVSIYVEHFNPARHLYDRLGFRHIDTNGVYHQMRWSAAPVAVK
jgi:ribosomal protein S18 acetylase RimI-like enzyme